MKHLYTMTMFAIIVCGAAASFAFASGDTGNAGRAEPTARRMLIHSHNDYAQKRPFWGAYEAG